MRNYFIPLLLAAIILVYPAAAFAQVLPSYQLTQWAIVGGGMQRGDGYQLVGYVGQSFAGRSSGNGYQLSSGFVDDSEPATQQLFLPIISR